MDESIGALCLSTLLGAYGIQASGFRRACGGRVFAGIWHESGGGYRALPGWALRSS